MAYIAAMLVRDELAALSGKIGDLADKCRNEAREKDSLVRELRALKSENKTLRNAANQARERLSHLLNQLPSP